MNVDSLRLNSVNQLKIVHQYVGSCWKTAGIGILIRHLNIVHHPEVLDPLLLLLPPCVGSFTKTFRELCSNAELRLSGCQAVNDAEKRNLQPLRQHEPVNISPRTQSERTGDEVTSITTLIVLSECAFITRAGEKAVRGELRLLPPDPTRRCRCREAGFVI